MFFSIFLMWEGKKKCVKNTRLHLCLWSVEMNCCCCSCQERIEAVMVFITKTCGQGKKGELQSSKNLRPFDWKISIFCSSVQVKSRKQLSNYNMQLKCFSIGLIFKKVFWFVCWLRWTWLLCVNLYKYMAAEYQILQ